MDMIVPEQTSTGDCDSIKRMMAHVGSKWSPMILSRLAQSPERFSALMRGLPGISQRMLTLTLREMERDGLINRKVTPTVPPRVDYSITELGLDLMATISSLGKWTLAHSGRIAAARQDFEQRSA